MFSGNYTPSVADIAAVTNGNCGNGYGYGGDWWAWIIIMALFGWGGFGYGGRPGFGGGFNGGNSCCTPATCAEVQNGFAQQSTQMMLNGIENGISSLGYDQLAQMNGINSNITNAANGIVSAINQSNITAMQNANAAARLVRPFRALTTTCRRLSAIWATRFSRLHSRLCRMIMRITVPCMMSLCSSR